MYRPSLRSVARAGAAMALVFAMAAPASAASNAWVRVLHASPDAPEVDVYVNGAKVDALSGLSFGDLSGYAQVPGGTYAIKVCATADATVCPIDVPSLAVAAGKQYTIAATNVLASIEAHVIVDDPSPVTNKTQVRVVHLSADTPAVDVLTQDGSTKVVDNLAYPDATSYLTLPAGAYDLKVCAHADNTVCPLDPASLDLKAGKSYSVFAIGSLTASSLTAAVGVDASVAPATDTVSATVDATGAGLPLGALALLVSVGLVAFVGSLRLVAVRVRR